jgi:hypothetical protein
VLSAFSAAKTLGVLGVLAVKFNVLPTAICHLPFKIVPAAFEAFPAARDPVWSGHPATLHGHLKNAARLQSPTLDFFRLFHALNNFGFMLKPAL